MSGKAVRASVTGSEAGAVIAPLAPPLIKVALLGDSQVSRLSCSVKPHHQAQTIVWRRRWGRPPS